MFACLPLHDEIDSNYCSLSLLDENIAWLVLAPLDHAQNIHSHIKILFSLSFACSQGRRRVALKSGRVSGKGGTFGNFPLVPYFPNQIYGSVRARKGFIKRLLIEVQLGLTKEFLYSHLVTSCLLLGANQVHHQLPC